MSEELNVGSQSQNTLGSLNKLTAAPESIIIPLSHFEVTTKLDILQKSRILCTDSLRLGFDCYFKNLQSISLWLAVKHSEHHLLDLQNLVVWEPSRERHFLQFIGLDLPLFCGLPRRELAA